MAKTDALYDIAISELFRTLWKQHGGPREVDFERKTFDAVIDNLVKTGKLAKPIANVPDIKYTYDARRDFPPGIASHGHWAIIGIGKSKYRVAKMKHNNLIRLPDDVKSILVTETFKDDTPPAIRAFLGKDEQATMTMVRYSGLIQRFTGLKEVHHLQGHERTSVSAGQVEIDEVYVGVDPNGQTHIIPISAKGGKDMLSYTQAYNLNLYATEKNRYDGSPAIPLGVVRVDDEAVYMIGFSRHVDVRQIEIERATRFSSV